MKDNPFYDASYMTFKTGLCNKLEELGSEWEIRTDDGKQAQDTDVYLLLSEYDLEDIYYDYIAQKSGNGFDPKALHEAVEQWVISNG